MTLRTSSLRPGHFGPRLDQDRAALYLRPLSWVYAGGRQAHRAVYELGLKTRRRLPRPVVCVGNLTVGGTGKTPFLIALAREIRERGLRPAVLSRGYGASPPAERPRVVAGERGLRLGPEASGDEPQLIARSLPGVPVVIGASRYEAGLLALREFEPDLFLLDDGFQHEALARDADLALWDLRDVPSRMRQLPAGRLREGLGGLRRASAMILTHAEYLRPAEREARRRRVLTELKAAAPDVPVFEARSELSGWRLLDRGGAWEESLRPIEELRGKTAVLVSGLARPGGFETLAREAGIEVRTHLRYADHARYDRERLNAIAISARTCGADLVLTTEKDAVKFAAPEKDDPPTAAATLAMRVEEPERWSAFLDRRLRGRRASSET